MVAQGLATTLRDSLQEFIDLLRRVENGEVEPTEDETAEFGVGGEDCPAFEGLYNFCRIYGGASVGACLPLPLP